MRLSVKVIPNAHADEVVGLINDAGGEALLKLKVRALAVDGQANEAVSLLLAKHFGVKKSAVRLIKGQTARLKIFEIDGL